MYVHGEITTMRLPPPIHVAGIVAAIVHALKPRVKKRTLLRIIRYALVPHPFPFGVITTSTILILALVLIRRKSEEKKRQWL